MDTLSYKTVAAKKETVVRKWHIIDAKGQVVGRMATKIANILRGKHKPSFSPHVDCGDYVVVVNAKDVIFTGSKMEDKQYIRYTGYPGGQRKRTAQQVMDRFPERILESAVRGMIPKTKLGRAVIKKLFIYVDGKHPHAAQKPEKLEL